MMTLTQVERLVRKIAEVASQPASDTQTAKLAQDYAEVCRAANHRLEQCAMMIEAGQFLQALQLAETAPPLMDLITLLGFRQAAEWRTYCQAHHLPWPEPFYDKYIRLLNEAYSKGITGDHPFYRDYRRAVMENDDARAFSILRVIARLNPSDANTKEELKRLEEKLLRVRLEGLRQILGQGDPAAIQAGLEQLESSGLPVPSSHPVWQQAQVARCQLMLGRAAHLRQQELWQEVEVVVEEIHTFATRYNVRLPDADADAWTALEEWTTEQRAAYAAAQDLQRAVSALEYEASSIASQRATGVRLAKADATNAFNSLAGKWREAERFGQPLGEDLAAQCQQSSDWLRQQVRAADRRKRLVAIVATIVILGAAGAAVPYFLGTAQQRYFAQRFGLLESARKVSEVGSLLAQVPDKLKANASMSDTLAKAKAFMAREKAWKEAFEQKLAGMQNITAAGFGSAPAQAAQARADCQRALNQLAPEYQPAARGELESWDAKWQAFRNDKLGGLLRSAEDVAGGLNATNGVAPVRAALAQMQAQLAGLAPLEAQMPPLEQGLANRLGQLTNKIEHWTATADKWDQAQAALGKASSLDQYLRALDQLVLSPFASLAQKEAAGRIDRLQLNQETLLGQLLLPNNPSNWPTLANVTGWSDRLMPEQPTSQETEVYLNLRNDKNMRDVSVYKLITNSSIAHNPYRTHNVAVQGAMERDNGGEKAGIVYDQTQFPDRLHFARTAYHDWDYSDVQRIQRTFECDSYERLELGALIDANTGNYSKPILRLFDQLNQETSANAIFRAFVTFKLWAVAQVRPGEWGLPWSPAAAEHIQALTRLGATELKSGDWMVPERREKFERPLQEYFEKVRNIPLEKQALFLRQLVRATCEKGFVFAGFIDASGHPVLQALTAPSSELCGWNRSGTARVLLRKAPGGESYTELAKPMPYTPLFAFAGERRELLLQTLNATGYPDSLAGPILPPFFEGAP